MNPPYSRFSPIPLRAPLFAFACSNRLSLHGYNLALESIDQRPYGCFVPTSIWRAIGSTTYSTTTTTVLLRPWIVRYLPTAIIIEICTSSLFLHSSLKATNPLWLSTAERRGMGHEGNVNFGGAKGRCTYLVSPFLRCVSRS